MPMYILWCLYCMYIYVYDIFYSFEFLNVSYTLLEGLFLWLVYMILYYKYWATSGGHIGLFSMHIMIGFRCI